MTYQQEEREMAESDSRREWEDEWGWWLDAVARGLFVEAE